MIYRPLQDFRERVDEVARSLQTNPEKHDIFLRVVARIDPLKVAAFQKKYADNLEKFHPSGPFKYADIPYWISDKINTAISLGLHRENSKSILDIGMGGGHFAAVCETLGHKVVGTDKNVALYNDICAVLELDRRLVLTEYRKPMPDLGLKFDMIVVIGQLFNIIRPIVDHKAKYWTTDDWGFFLRDLIDHHMIYPGVIFLHLNSNIVENGTARDLELLQWARDHGATASEVTNRVLFTAIHGWETLEAAKAGAQPAAV